MTFQCQAHYHLSDFSRILCIQIRFHISSFIIHFLSFAKLTFWLTNETESPCRAAACCCDSYLIHQVLKSNSATFHRKSRDAGKSMWRAAEGLRSRLNKIQRWQWRNSWSRSTWWLNAHSMQSWKWEMFIWSKYILSRMLLFSTKIKVENMQKCKHKTQKNIEDLLTLNQADDKRCYYRIVHRKSSKIKSMPRWELIWLCRIQPCKIWSKFSIILHIFDLSASETRMWLPLHLNFNEFVIKNNL